MCRPITATILPPFAVLVALVAPVSARAGDPSGDEFFETQVRPLLVARCAECHGGSAKVKGGLRLTSREAVLKGGDSGPAAVPGKPDESAIVAAIRYVEEPRMPPKAKLVDAEIGVLTKWVERGLPWPAAASETAPAAVKSAWRITDEQRKHWSYQPLRDPAPPKVSDSSWVRSDLDRFVLAGLERKGLKPAPPADRRTLIRRATFDLVGLPPTPEEVEAFVNDRSPEAFARVVDRLLASPRYGERWGRHWLDLVRYADSRDARGVGGSDDIGEAWRYRDWVVAAFNRDQPYDRFLIDQVAGDLIPGPGHDGFNAEGMVATGLLTIGEWGTGDADKEKMMTDIVADQVDVVGRAFMGLTLACARCHDHKFDPISNADYYGLAGIFFSTHILPDPGAKTAGSPMLRTPIVPASTIAAAESYKVRLASLEKEQKSAIEAASRSFARSQLPRTADYLRAAADFATSESASLDEVALGWGVEPAALRRWLQRLGLASDGTPLDRPVSSVGGAAGFDIWTGPSDPPWVGVNRTDAPITVSTLTLPPRSVCLHPGPTEPAAVAWSSPISGAVTVAGRIADADPNGGNGVTWSVEHRRGRSWRALASGDLPNGGKAAIGPIAATVAPGDALRLVVAPKGEYSFDTTTIDLTITPAGGPDWNLTADLVPDLLRGGKGNPHADRTGRPDIWRFVRVNPTAAGRREGTSAPLAAWLDALDKGDANALESATMAVERASNGGGLADELTSPGGPFYPGPGELSSEARSRLSRRQAEIGAMRASPPPPIPMGLVAQEGGVPKSVYEKVGDVRIQIRGEYSRLGPVVPRRFPTILAGETQPPITKGSGRLELARWLARPEHPLTARVMANRIWEFHFGEGIVRTPSNFGKLGEPPSDPDLLDYLSRRFIASGWSIKAMHRLIMNSAAYQQSAAAPADSLRLDPENRLFGRMNRRRLESELIRDSLLSAAGRLDPSMGGPAYRDFNVPRRTLYLMTIRSDRSSFGPLFDAADSTAMVDKRVVSTVAPQALFLLNNPFVFDQARAFAERVRREAGTTEARVDRAYRLAFGRAATAEEIGVGRGIVGAENDPPAWAGYAHVLLCANEFLFIE
ncbi:MAG TPA: PSD1 and planctomycete cytochrome C domain-containing protein [Isosphaeraceae bacterium]